MESGQSSREGKDECACSSAKKEEPHYCIYTK